MSDVPEVSVVVVMPRSSWWQIERDLENLYGTSLSDTEVGESIEILSEFGYHCDQCSYPGCAGVQRRVIRRHRL